MINKFLYVLLGIYICSNLVSCNQQSDNYILLDTDISSDADDVGAVAVLHALADQRSVNIKGMVISSGDFWSKGCLDTLNVHFNSPTIPVGLVATETPVVHTSAYTREIADLSEKNNISKSEDGVTLYRRVLSTMPDHSVVIVTVGYLTNLRVLLDSQPDEYSKQTGFSLVQQKVKMLVSMGGDYPAGKEWNFYQDPGAAKYVVEKWPTDIFFIGFSLGRGIVTGQKLRELPITNPVRKSYELHNGLKGRPSWDQLAVLFAGMPEKARARYFKVSEPGINSIEKNGANQWYADAEGAHYFLTLNVEKQEIAELISQLMLKH